MFDSIQTASGTRYTTVVALLALAFIFSPAVLIVSRPFGYRLLALSTGSSAACTILAWFKWKRSSQFAVPSIAGARGQ